MYSINLRLPVFAPNSKMSQYISRANDQFASYKRRVKYFLKCVDIASKHAFMGNRNVKQEFLTSCYQALCHLNYQSDKLEKALYFNNKIIPTYLRNEADHKMYYRYKLGLALMFSHHNTINHVIKSLQQSNFANKCLWYYTFRLRYAVIMHKYEKAAVWHGLGRRISIYDAATPADRLSFKIWSLYMNICIHIGNETELDKENEISWNENILSIQSLSDSAIIGLVYIALRLQECGIWQTLQANIWRCLLKVPQALAEYYVSIECFKQKALILSHIKMKRAINRTPELPIIKKNGQYWMNMLDNIVNGFCCDCCGVRRNRNEIVLRACTGCIKVLYCSKKCQKRSWKYGHRLICKR